MATIYLDIEDKTYLRIKKLANNKKVSVSQWILVKLENLVNSDLPFNFTDLYKSIAEEVFAYEDKI